MRPFLFAILLLQPAISLRGQAQSCSSIGKEKKEAILRYVRSKYRLSDDIALVVSADTPVVGTCFHQLKLQGQSSLKQWTLELFLTPDSRYLTTDLFDLTLNPEEEERHKNEALMTGLVENRGASAGSAKALVTIVEFSDFECPFCRGFALIAQEFLQAEQGNVRLVFHHMPLSMHPWARKAAEGAACAQLQNSGAFWSIHDQLFQHQREITVGNINETLDRMARATPNLNYQDFRNCVNDQMSLGLVLRDLNLASASGVNSTPTLFINGHRVLGVKDVAQLKTLVEEAKKEAEQGNATRNARPDSLER